MHVCGCVCKFSKNWTGLIQKWINWDFPGGTVVKNPPANAGDMGLTSGPGGPQRPQGN